MLFKILMFIILSTALISCNKPDPNPELKDPIFNDLNSKLGSARQALEAEKKALQEHEQALRDVVPQTGQIKYAQKRVYDAQAKIQKLGQEIRYLELKIQSRKSEAKKSYLVAFKKGEEWPNPAEYTMYDAANRLRAAKSSWDTNARVKALAPGGARKNSATSHGDASPPEEKKSNSGDGHH